MWSRRFVGLLATVRAELYTAVGRSGDDGYASTGSIFTARPAEADSIIALVT